MAKKAKKSAYLHHELGIYNGMSFKLVVPSKYNKEKYPNYFIQYDGSIKYYTGIKVLYNKFLELTEELQTVQQLVELLIPKIKNEILPSLIEKASIEDLTRLSDLVTTAINKYFGQQERLFEIGELVDISDYRDRNKKLNDYFAIHLNGKLKLTELNKDVWHKFRYYLLSNYNIKANSTVNQYITYFKSFYNWLQNDQEVIISNHVQKLKRLDTSKQDKKYSFIELGLVEELLNALSSDNRWLRLNIICLLVFENAKRPIQAYRLQAKDIDLQNQVLYLSPKSRNKPREVTYISDELAELIRKVYANTAQAGRVIEPNDFLLGGRNCFKKGGKEITQGDIRDLQIVPFRKAYPQFKNILIYSLKHTTITSVSEYDLSLAQRMANHSHQSTTEIYDRKKKSSKAIPRNKLINEYKLR